MQLETDGQTPGRAQGAGAMMGLLRKGMFVGIGLLLLMPQAKTAKGYAMPTQNACRLSVVYNNVPLKAGLQTAWGFACLVELPDRTVLFDTGGNGSVLLSNMKAMGFSPEEVDAVVLSHLHGDHPNVAAMAEQARDVMGKDIELLLGGFHLGGSSQSEIQSVCTRLQALGVQKIAPSHCTGEQAIRVFRQKWGKDFIQGGLGARLEMPQDVSPD